MAGASRFKTSSHIKLESGASDTTGQVLRPVVRHWINTFRQKKSKAVEITPESGVAPIVPGAPTDAGARISELQHQAAEVLAACDEWTERSQCFETNLDRAREQREQSAERLAIAGESIPDENTEQFSVLQESYRNFTMAFELQEQKLEHAQQKIATFQEKHACICAEVLALSDDPRDTNSSIDNSSSAGSNSLQKAA